MRTVDVENGGVIDAQPTVVLNGSVRVLGAGIESQPGARRDGHQAFARARGDREWRIDALRPDRAHLAAGEDRDFADIEVAVRDPHEPLDLERGRADPGARGEIELSGKHFRAAGERVVDQDMHRAAGADHGCRRRGERERLDRRIHIDGDERAAGDQDGIGWRRHGIARPVEE
jgi:hypothetical protein